MSFITVTGLLKQMLKSFECVIYCTIKSFPLTKHQCDKLTVLKMVADGLIKISSTLVISFTFLTTDCLSVCLAISSTPMQHLVSKNIKTRLACICSQLCKIHAIQLRQLSNIFQRVRDFFTFYYIDLLKSFISFSALLCVHNIFRKFNFTLVQHARPKLKLGSGGSQSILGLQCLLFNSRITGQHEMGSQNVLRAI